VCNYPIQGVATGEIVPIGLAYLWHRVKAEQMETILVNTVHDSVEAEAPPSEVEFFTELATCALINDVVEHIDRTYNYTMVVQMGLGFTVGSHWGNNTYDYTAFVERASDQTVQYAWDGDELSVEVTL
jgi:DNA polymerase I-like protein with 3'-5' exonuclease and polymerase domains